MKVDFKYDKDGVVVTEPNPDGKFELESLPFCLLDPDEIECIKRHNPKFMISGIDPYKTNEKDQL